MKSLATRTAAEHFCVAEEHWRARRVAAALDSYERALRAGFDSGACNAQRWMCFMHLGQFEAAGRLSDAIGQGKGSAVWNRARPRGQRVLIRCIHGFGDAIQFIRYVPLLRDRNVSVMAQTHPEMVPVLSCVSGLDFVFTWGVGISTPPYDCDIEVMELPYAFRTTLETIPATVPYMRVPPERVARRRERFPISAKRQIGLVWASSAWDVNRDVPLSLFEPLTHVPNVELFSLQFGPAHRQLYNTEFTIRHSGEQSSEILNTAADILNLDIVVTVDTMVAHLAGALGKPVCVLLPFEADWRWMVDRRDSPWYPTMRLYRQRVPGDWTTPIAQLAQDLRSYTYTQDGPRLGK